MTMMWVFLAVLALGIGVAVWAVVSLRDGGRPPSILAERFARGELSPEEYRERLELLGDRSPGVRRLWTPIGVGLIALGLIGAVAAGGMAMGRGEMGWMMRGMPMMDGMNGMGDMTGDTGRRGGAPSEGAPERVVEAMDFSFSPETVRIPADDTVNITLDNKGASYHTFTVRGLDFELRAQGGEQISGSLRPSKPGRYSAVCTVAGHERMGMSATVVVEEQGDELGSTIVGVRA